MIKTGTFYCCGVVDDVWYKKEIYYKVDVTSTSNRLAAYSDQNDDSMETELDKE